MIATADFFTPVVDDPYDWGRIAAANALSDVYAMGGGRVVALNLRRLAARHAAPGAVRRGAARWPGRRARGAAATVAGGHTIDDPEPKYGMAVTGIADPDRLLRNDAARAGLPLTLTKPLGVGVLNNRHKATGEVFPRRSRRWPRSTPRRRGRRWPPGRAAATDVTGFGLLGHLFKLLRAVRGRAVIDGGRRAAARRRPRGRARRVRRGWHAPQPRLGAPAPRRRGRVSEDELLLLADAQTSGGLLVVGEVPGASSSARPSPGSARVALS